MNIATWANYLKQIEETSARNEVTVILADLLKNLTADEVSSAIYLSLGTLGPLYQEVDLNISEKLMFRVLAQVTQKREEDMVAEYKKYGDFGDLVLAFKLESSLKDTNLSITKVFRQLIQISEFSGNGSQEMKISALAKLLSELDPLSGKYIARIPVKKLRLGFSDVTILDALSWMLVGDKTARKEIEQAYNVTADIGYIASLVKKKGLSNIHNIEVTVGIPIRPAAAERLPTAEAIIEKLGEVSVEPKIDGFRLQCHYSREGLGPFIDSNKLFSTSNCVRIFSRNLEDMTGMFPDLVSEIEKMKIDSIVFEGEAVAYNNETGEFLPFQETIQRRRKYDIESKSQEIPLKLFGFDLLYLNGKTMIHEPLEKRKKLLAGVIGGGKGRLLITESVTVKDAKGLSNYFNLEISKGLEGIMVKRLGGEYSAGARNFNWVKLKREEKGELTDSIDCVVLGYKFGKGKRTNFGIGAFLVGVYDTEEDIYKTVSNIGTGLTDRQWMEMKERADKLVVRKKPILYDIPLDLDQDVWVQPEMVVEILADEITQSPLHTAGFNKMGSGLALRFPRLIKWRDDKSPTQATSVNELIEMFRHQKKRSARIHG